MELPVHADKGQIAAFCRKHHITKLAFFGSVLTGRFGPDSDVDVLIEFDPEHIPGLIALSGKEREFSQILGRKADMRTPNDLSRYFRDEIVREAASRLSRKLRKTNPDIPWQDMIGMRNRLIHAYFDLDLDIIWQTASRELPGIIPRPEALLGSA